MIKMYFVLPILIVLVLFSCNTTDDQELIGFSTDDVYSIASYVEENKDEYSKFWQVIETTDSYSILNAYNPNGDGYTLFLPTDNAFDRYIESSDDYSSFEALLSDTTFLNVLIRYHIVNSSLASADFPYGALSDSTLLGDYLTIGLEITEDTSIFKVNNVAPLLAVDVETNNGYVHVISEVLEPITYSAYQWLANNDGYSILAQTLEITGVSELMGAYELSTTGALVKNNYSVLAEHDSIFQQAGITSVDDVIAKYNTEGMDYTDPDNGLYQFAAYHVIDGQYFLDDFEDVSNYNTFAVYPVSVNADLDIQINTGVDTFETVVSGTDTTYINYISVDMINSNVNTKNGPIHFVSEVLELFEPTRKDIIYDFTNDPVIESLGNGTFYLYDPSEYEFLSWDGVESLKYYSPYVTTSEGFIEIDGDFNLSYTTPAILPGEYEVYFRMNSNSELNAIIQVKIDGVRVGGNVNLTSGSGAYTDILIGTVNFTGNDYHLIEINSLIPGRVRWSEIQLIPQ